MPAGIYLTPKCLKVIEGHSSYQGAWNSYQTLKKILGKTGKQKITIEDYCKAEGVTAKEVLSAFVKNKTA